MSNFDSNPFADPVQTERFDEKKGKSVRQTDPAAPLIPPPPKPAATVPSAPKKELDDFNPFDDAQQPITDPKPQDKPPRGAEGISWFGFGKTKQQKYTVSGGDVADTPPPPYPESGTAALRELKQKEDELAQREQAIREREELANRGPVIHPNNFPPLPGFCPVKPCFYHDIGVEIPPDQQKLVRGIFVWFLVHCVLYIVNVIFALIGMIAMLAVGGAAANNNTFFAHFGFSLAILVLFLPAALFCFYLPLYRAFRSDSSMNFMCFFFVCIFQVGIYVCHMIGVPGGCGLILGILLFASPGTGGGSRTFLLIWGGVYCIYAFIWAGMALALCIFVYYVHRYYRLSGASLAAARQEIFTTAASNETVRSAVKTGVTEAATNPAVRSAVADGVKSGVSSGFSAATKY